MDDAHVGDAKTADNLSLSLIYPDRAIESAAQSMEGVMKSIGSFLRLIPQLERRREAVGAAAAAVAPYDLLALKAKDTQLLIMLPVLNRQTRKLKVRSSLVPSGFG